MALNYEFKSCFPEGQACQDSVWSFRVNSTLKDEGLEFWYEDKSDFTRNDTAPAFELESADINNDGDPRTKNNNTSFKDGQDFTLNEDCSSSFIQRVHEIYVNANDQQRLDFTNCGLDVKKVTYKGDGSYTEELWEAASFTAFAPPFRTQIPEDEPATMEFSLLFQNEPTVKNVGFISDLPSTVTAPTADVTITPTVPLTIMYTLDNIEDPDSLIVNDTFQTFVYDKNGQLVISETYNSGDFPVNELVLDGGEYVVALAYLLFDDGTDQIYKNLLVKNVTVSAKPVIFVTTDPVAYTTAQNGTITYGDLVVDGGIIAGDDIDGTITDEIVFNGTQTSTDLIDLSTTGTFPITLDVTNSQNVNADQQTIDINVT